MQISTIPIIHARTKNVDFRSNLLVVPDFFTLDDIKWCHTYITESTRFFEMVDKKGRQVLFSNESYVVIGLSIFIRDLYELCNKAPQYHLVDGSRTNYAFLGFLFRKKDILSPFNIPYEFYLEQYERTMNARWLDPTTPHSLLPTREPFSDMEFPDSEVSKPRFHLPFETQKAIFNSEEFSAETLISEILTNIQREHDISFCSNLPNASSFIDSHFKIGTSVYAKQINPRINNNYEKKTQIGKTTERSSTPTLVQQGVDSMGALESENNSNESITSIDQLEAKLKNSKLVSSDTSTYRQIEHLKNSVDRTDIFAEKENARITISTKDISSKGKKTSNKAKRHVISFSFKKRRGDME